jgi:F0F1-type ATP synthase assembly protein I
MMTTRETISCILMGIGAGLVAGGAVGSRPVVLIGALLIAAAVLVAEIRPSGPYLR